VARFSVGMTHAMGGRRGGFAFELRGVRVLRTQVAAAQVAGALRFADEDLSVARWFGAQHVGESRNRPAPRLRDGMRCAQADTAILRMYCGPLQGSRWAVFDLAPGSVARNETAVDRVTQAVGTLATGVWQEGLRPRFRAAEGRVLMDVCLPLMNPGAAPVTVTATLTVNGAGRSSRTITLPARQSEAVDLVFAEGLAAPRLAQEPLELCVATRASAGPVVGDGRFRLDARAALRGICDAMLARAREDGSLHGYSFIDNRGIRVLLGGYEIFCDSRYRDAALRWGMTLLAEQREDGGYRMGYGITSKGEECYVADGGEIVVGILRLAAYAEPALRGRLLASADRYMRYRVSRSDAGCVQGADVVVPQRRTPCPESLRLGVLRAPAGRAGGADRRDLSRTVRHVFDGCAALDSRNPCRSKTGAIGMALHQLRDAGAGRCRVAVGKPGAMDGRPSPLNLSQGSDLTKH